MTKFEICAATHRGLVRSSNEDALAIEGKMIAEAEYGPSYFGPFEGKGTMMIADGMGGHRQGALASKMALSSLIASSRGAGTEVDWLDAINRANDAVYDLMEVHPAAQGMGTTIVGAVLEGQSVLHFNVGDSRAYLYSSGRLTLLSHDDVPLARTNLGGRRQTHQITQSLGGLSRRATISPHVGRIEMPIGDSLVLLCSDGLTDVVEETAIAELIASASSLEERATCLLRATLAMGGTDNVSLVLARRHAP